MVCSLSSTLFLSESEKATLGPYVNSPFINYNKSKEACEKHAKSRLHLFANDKAYKYVLKAHTATLTQGLTA